MEAKLHSGGDGMGEPSKTKWMVGRKRVTTSRRSGSLALFSAVFKVSTLSNSLVFLVIETVFHF